MDGWKACLYMYLLEIANVKVKAKVIRGVESNAKW